MNCFAKSRTGRVLLHALCLARHPAHALWHWRGIVREFALGRPATTNAQSLLKDA
jgi:hypothetical protein